jgi:hypothetical protein
VTASPAPAAPPRARRWPLTVVVLAAALTGALSTKPLLGVLMERHATHNGPWRTSATTGSSAANPWERATVALAGLYALTPQEAIYYTAFTDSSGEPLRGDCRYAVRGTAPPARWWSLTAYGADHFLVPNPAHRYARNASNLRVGPDGRFEIAVAAQAPAENGLPSPPQGPFSLTLRLYNPAPDVLQQIATLPLPRITREGCP